MSTNRPARVSVEFEWLAPSPVALLLRNELCDVRYGRHGSAPGYGINFVKNGGFALRFAIKVCIAFRGRRVMSNPIQF